jgi:hypothetical protein
MTNENRKDTAVPEPGPAQGATDENAVQSPSTDPWLAFLTDEKASVKKFLGSIRKGAIRIPDATARDAFAQALFAGPPGRVKRLLALMRDSARASDTISGIVYELAEAAIRRVSALRLPAGLNEDMAYQASVSAWVDDQPKRPLRPNELQILLLLIQFGLHRRYVDEDAAMALIALAARPVSKRRKASLADQRDAVTSALHPIDVILAVPPVAKTLAALAAHGEAWQARLDGQERILRIRASEIEQLSGECVRKDDIISTLRETVAQLEMANGANAAKVADLERQILDLSDGWQHKVDDIRGRIRGTLSGQFTRCLQTALDAVRSDPPVTSVIQERLEDALKLLERELKWLQPSA